MPPTILRVLDPEPLERITARRADLDELEEHLVGNWRRYELSATNLPSPNVSLNSRPRPV